MTGANVEQVRAEIRSSAAPKNAAAAGSRATLREVQLALDENGEQREARIRKLFEVFDPQRPGGDGARDAQQLRDVQELRRVCPADRDGRIDYQRFRRYIDDKEIEIYQMFRQIDATKDGVIEPNELRDALWSAGIFIKNADLSKFVDHVDRDNNGIITFEEWRDFLLLSPRSGTITEVYQYWEKTYQIDIGEQAIIPEGISRQLHASKYLIAGGVAGAVSRTATAPLDRLKVILQVQTKVTGKVSLLEGLKQIYRQGGFVGYYVGNGINILKVAPESAVKFYAFETLKELMAQLQGKDNKMDIGPAGRLLSGGAAGAIAQTVVYPLDVVKTRLQVYQGRSAGFAPFVRDIWLQEGPRALYSGLVPSLIGIVPYAGIDLAMYETLKDASRSLFPAGTDPGPWTQLACGTVSGGFSATCVYPLQLIRTRLQAQSRNAPGKYTGMMDVLRKTVENEGVSGLYKGLLPNICKVAPSASITYVVYEMMKKWLSIS